MAIEGDNSFGIAAVILGILSIALFFLIIPPIILGVIGFIFALIQRKRNPNKWSVWGITLSIIGILITVIVLVSLGSFISNTSQIIENCLANPTDPGCEQIISQLNAYQNVPAN